MPNIRVTVAYATETTQWLREVVLPAHASVDQAVQASGLLVDCALAWPCDVGVYGRRVDAAHVLEDGDRVELYRPLKLTPNEARLLRAKRAQKR